MTLYFLIKNFIKKQKLNKILKFLKCNENFSNFSALIIELKVKILVKFIVKIFQLFIISINYIFSILKIININYNNKLAYF